MRWRNTQVFFLCSPPHCEGNRRTTLQSYTRAVPWRRSHGITSRQARRLLARPVSSRGWHTCFTWMAALPKPKCTRFKSSALSPWVTARPTVARQVRLLLAIGPSYKGFRFCWRKRKKGMACSRDCRGCRKRLCLRSRTSRQPARRRHIRLRGMAVCWRASEAYRCKDRDRSKVWQSGPSTVSVGLVQPVLCWLTWVLLTTCSFLVCLIKYTTGLEGVHTTCEF
mmetsp:Transcript_22636/g.56636  ORF Transcript_22636/g.56636 Transcript_22636/m.56636 type:complete len:224 (-) Transcript_22636:742-1413(-)